MPEGTLPIFVLSLLGLVGLSAPTWMAAASLAPPLYLGIGAAALLLLALHRLFQPAPSP